MLFCTHSDFILSWLPLYVCHTLCHTFCTIYHFLLCWSFHPSILMYIYVFMTSFVCYCAITNDFHDHFDINGNIWATISPFFIHGNQKNMLLCYERWLPKKWNFACETANSMFIPLSMCISSNTMLLPVSMHNFQINGLYCPPLKTMTKNHFGYALLQASLCT
jgi:hypothetical protein